MIIYQFKEEFKFRLKINFSSTRFTPILVIRNKPINHVLCRWCLVLRHHMSCHIDDPKEELVWELHCSNYTRVRLDFPGLLWCFLPCLNLRCVQCSDPSFGAHWVYQKVVLAIVDEDTGILNAVLSVWSKANRDIVPKVHVHIIVAAYISVIIRNPIKYLGCIFLNKGRVWHWGFIESIPVV